MPILWLPLRGVALPLLRLLTVLRPSSWSAPGLQSGALPFLSRLKLTYNRRIAINGLPRECRRWVPRTTTKSGVASTKQRSGALGGRRLLDATRDASPDDPDPNAPRRPRTSRCPYEPHGRVEEEEARGAVDVTTVRRWWRSVRQKRPR